MEIIFNDVVDKAVSRRREGLQKLALGIEELKQSVVNELVYNTKNSEFDALPKSYDDIKKLVESSTMRYLIYALRDVQHQIYKEH